MSRLAGYAAEIERYLHGMPVVRDDPEEDERAASVRREAGELRAMQVYERAGGSGRSGGGQAGGGSGLHVAGRDAGAPGMRSASGKPPKPPAATTSPKAASAPIMIYTATLAGFRPAEE